MRNRIVILGLLLLLTACFDDKSMLGGNPIIEIGIKNDVRDTINIYFNDELRINSEVDANGSRNISYEWGVGEYKTSNKEDAYGKEYLANTTVFTKVSTEKDLVFIPRELGHYMVRQVVTNEHGSTIKYHHLFVNSPFEEGFMILARDPQGIGNLSFLKTLTPEEIEMGMKPTFLQNVYRDVNGEEQYKDPVDIFKIGGSIYILYQEDQRLVRMNDKTLEKILEFDFRYYKSDFAPTSATSYDGKYCTVLTVASKNGGVAQVQLAQSGIFHFTSKLPQGYKYTHVYSRPSYFRSCTEVFTSTDKNVVCASGFAQGATFSSYLDCYAYFKDKEVMHIFQNEKYNGNDINIINKQGGVMKITKVGSSITDFQNGGLSKLFEYTIPYPEMIDEKTKFLRNDLYSCVFFNYKNGVYKWYYSQDNTMPSVDKKHCQLPEGEEVRSLAHYVLERSVPIGVDYQSESKRLQTQIYVATYNPNRAGEYKGSMYVFNAETGAEVMRYEGISYEPVEIMYKNK